MGKTNKTRQALSAELATALTLLASRGPVFTVEEFAQAAGRTKSGSWRVLHFLLQGRWVERLGKGTYSIVPLEAGPEGAWSEDPFVIACYLAKPGSVAYWSACQYWNWTEQVPRTVFVQTTQRKMKTRRVVAGVTYRFVQVRPNKFFGHIERRTDRGTFTITDREKTLVDALDHPELCGGIRLVADIVSQAAEALDWAKVDQYLVRMGSGAVYKRLGFIVEEWLPQIKIPQRAQRLKRWQARLTGGYALLAPGEPPTGRACSRWRVRVNVPEAVPKP